MIVAAAREINDRDVVFVGVGPAMAAAYLAKMTHAPRARILFESGIIDSVPVDSPLGIADPRLSRKCAKSCGLFYALSLLQRGYVDISLLGGAQIDKYGNINSTVLGAYRTPSRRLPGSGGANDAASHSKRFIVLMPHEKRRFPESVSYITSPGFIDGPEGRKEAGLKNGGPARVITDLAVLGFHKKSKTIQLESLHPDVTVSEIEENTGFRIVIPRRVRTTEPPTVKQLDLLRSKIDPDRLYVNKWNVT
jgi:acyl CoA:acetate/3-ketoacid CoA transferase beta subunit